MTRRTGPEPDVGALPADKEIVDFLENCSTPPSVKEVARAFNLPQELRAPLRRTGRAVARAIPREADFDFSAATRTSPTVRASAKVQAISMRGCSQSEVCDASDSEEDRIGRRSCRARACDTGHEWNNDFAKRRATGALSRGKGRSQNVHMTFSLTKTYLEPCIKTQIREFLCKLLPAIVASNCRQIVASSSNCRLQATIWRQFALRGDKLSSPN